MQLQNTNSDNTTILIHKTTFKKRLPAIMLAASYVLCFFFIGNGIREPLYPRCIQCPEAVQNKNPDILLKAAWIISFCTDLNLEIEIISRFMVIYTLIHNFRPVRRIS